MLRYGNTKFLDRGCQTVFPILFLQVPRFNAKTFCLCHIDSCYPKCGPVTGSIIVSGEPGRNFLSPTPALMDPRCGEIPDDSSAFENSLSPSTHQTHWPFFPSFALAPLPARGRYRHIPGLDLNVHFCSTNPITTSVFLIICLWRLPWLACCYGPGKRPRIITTENRSAVEASRF